MSEINEINENTITVNFDRDFEYITSNFDRDFEYIEDTYEYILRPFENMLETGEQIDTFTEEKLNHIKELNFEYMICAVCAKHGFLNIIKWLRVQDTHWQWDEKICEIVTHAGYLNILQWIRSQNPPCPWNKNACINAAGNGKPIFIIMKTEMGYPIDFMVGSHKWHGIAPSDTDLENALAQLPTTLADY
jgi:hypothetical protein